MNQLKDQINNELKDALKSGDAFRRSVLGMLKAAIHNKEIEKRKKEEGLNEDETREVIRAEAKKRMDSAGAYRLVGEEERSKSEESEAAILKKYLPPEATDEDIKKTVEKVFAAVSSKSKKDFGRIMGAVVKELKGGADGGRVKQILESMLE